MSALTSSAADGPSNDGFVITPNDTVALSNTSSKIYVGGAGNISVQTLRGTNLIFFGALAGTILPVRVARVYANNTTSNNLIALV